MNIETEFFTAPVPVTILTTHGDIDASNYKELIQVVGKLYQDGTRNLLLDLGDTSYMSSSGMVAFHSITIMMNGGRPLDPEDGWAALADMGEGPGAAQTHLKLLNVQPRVAHTLEISGFKTFYEFYNNRDAALASFQTAPATP